MQILMSVILVLTTVQRKLTATIPNTDIIAHAKRDTVVMDAFASESKVK